MISADTLNQKQEASRRHTAQCNMREWLSRADGFETQSTSKTMTPEYQILCQPTHRELQTAVNTLIAEGWQPQGGVTVMNSLWAQAMVRGFESADGWKPFKGL